MSLRPNRHQNLRTRLLAAAGVLAFALSVVAALRLTEGSAPARVTISPSNPEDLRSQLVQILASEAKQRQIDVTVIQTDGTIDAVEQVNSGKLDFAVVLGGLNFSGFTNVRLVAALQVVPLHMLVKEELLDAVSRKLPTLRGHVVNFAGGRKSVTYWITRDLLEFAQLYPPSAPDRAGDYTESSASLTEILAIKKRDLMPDAIFSIQTLPSPPIMQLVEKQGYRLVPLPFSDAFTLRALTSERQFNPSSPEPALSVLKEHVYDAVIPAYTYQISPGVPPANLRTLGVHQLLVTKRTMDRDVVVRLLETIYDTHFVKLLQQTEGYRPEDRPSEILWHEGALRYFRQNQPVITEKLLTSLGGVMTIVGPSFGGLICVWQWFRQRARARRERSIEAYITKISDIELRAMDLEQATASGADVHHELHKLQRELSRFKSEALGQFARDDMAGSELMTSFLAHVNDARSHLTALGHRLQQAAQHGDAAGHGGHRP